jgi:hypothetical protein
VGSASNSSEYYEAKFQNQYITLVAPTGMNCSSPYNRGLDGWAFTGVGITNAWSDWNEAATSSGVILTSVIDSGALAPGQIQANPSTFACAVLSGNAAIQDHCVGISEAPQRHSLKVLAMNATNSAGVIEILDPTNSFFELMAGGGGGLFGGSQAETILIAYSDSSRQADLFACDLPLSQSNDCNQDVGIAFQILKRMVGA